MKDGRLALGEFHLPVSLEKPPPSYSMLSPEVTHSLLVIMIVYYSVSTSFSVYDYEHTGNQFMENLLVL